MDKHHQEKHIQWLEINNNQESLEEQFMIYLKQLKVLHQNVNLELKCQFMKFIKKELKIY